MGLAMTAMVAAISSMIIMAAVPAVAYADYWDLPLKEQVKQGISPEEIACKADMQLMLKKDGSPICVKTTSVDRIVNMGFATVVEGAKTAPQMASESMEMDAGMADDSMEMDAGMADDSMEMDAGMADDSREIHANMTDDIVISADDAKRDAADDAGMDNAKIPATDEVSISMNSARQAATDALAIYQEHGEDAFEMITALNVANASYPFVIAAAESATGMADGGPMRDIREAWTNQPYQSAIEVADGSVLDRRGEIILTPIELEAQLSGVIDTLEADSGAWIKYVFVNPDTGENQAKQSWVILHDNYVFGSGFYLEGDMAVAAEVEWSLAKTVATYNQLGMADSFMMIDSMEVADGAYPFVLDRDGMFVAHGADPSLIGTAISEQEIDRGWDEVLAELENPLAKMSYEFHSPADDNGQQMYTKLKMHDNYVFGSKYHHGATAGMGGS